MKTLAPWMVGLALFLPLTTPLPACSAPPASRVAAATVIELPDAGVSMTLPQEWSAQKDGVKYFVFPNDQSMAMVVAVVDDKRLDGFVRDIKKNQEATLGTVRSTGTEHVQVNGLEVTRESGTGDSPDGPALWSLAVVRARRPIIIYTLTSRVSMKKHEAEYNAMLASLKKLD